MTTPDALCGRLLLGAELILDGAVLCVDEAATLRTAADLIQQQLATIERLSAALEYAKGYLAGVHEFAALAEVQAIALGKDAK